MSGAVPVSHDFISVDYNPFAGGELARVVPTTESQREIWLANQLGTDASLAFNLSVSLRLRGILDARALRSALQELVDRHDALRASFGPDGETLCIRQHVAFELPVIDLSTLAGDAGLQALEARLRNSVETPFRIEFDALFRAELLQLGPQESLLILSAHHIVCDGWSWWVIVRELGALYARYAGLADASLLQAEDFTDYAIAEFAHPQTAQYRLDEAFWLSRFADEIPVLDLPTDRARPARRSFASARVDHVLDVELVAAIRRMGARRGASLFATLLAGFSGLLSRLSGQGTIVVGIPAAGQSSAGQTDLVGHCVNTLPLRFDLDPGQSFAKSVDDAQVVLLDALEHQRYTFGTLLKKLPIQRDPSRMPLVSVLFNIDQALESETTAFPGLELEFSDNPRSFDTFELFVNAAQVHGTLRLECQYNRDLFDDATVRRWLGAYESLLRAATLGIETSVASLPLVDAAARGELAALQPAPVPFPRERLMHEYLELQCDRAPDRIALRFGQEAMTYSQLESRANRIAHLLRAAGARRGALVGISIDRGIDMLASLLGILKTGAGYVPLDPQFPADRLAYMAEDAGLAALITERKYAARFDLDGRPVLAIDEMEAQIASAPDLRIGHDLDCALPESVAYVIYTSGSTGRPKGVQVQHSAVSNFLTGMQAQPGLGADDRLLAVTTLSFDIAVLELMLPLSVGAQVVLADRDTASDAIALARLLDESGATVMQATPSTWRLLLETGWSGGPGFSALCGGEALAPDLAAALLPRCGALWNLYGPTETTVWSTAAKVQAGADGRVSDIHIGRPIANTRIWILDAQGELCPRGVPGEICIGGQGVTLGYLARPELTADRFIADRHSDPDANVSGERPMLYRTGDRGRWRADGNIEHMGRMDFQVKVRGYRIELEEIDNNLATHPSVARVVTVARELRPGDVRLIAYVVAQPGSAIVESGLAAHLRGTLPEYMIPQHIVVLDAIPLLPNGKVDRKSLPAPQELQSAHAARREPRNGIEARIASIMADVLGVASVGMDEDFFAVGGHSLLGARLTTRISRELGVQLPLRALFDAPTVGRLADFIGDQVIATTTAHMPPPVVRQDNQETAPLSLMQQRLWVIEQMQPGQAAYNIQSAHRLRGPLDLIALDDAFKKVVKRQATLRTQLEPYGDAAIQRVHAKMEASLLPVEDLTRFDEKEREAEVMRRMEALTAEPMPLDQAPLFRARLFRLSAEDHMLFFMAHHAIWDGVSLNLFCEEMAELYATYSEGGLSTMPELKRSYCDFTAWHLQQLEEGSLRPQIDHWMRHLAGELEPLHLPEDFPRPAQATGKGGGEIMRIDAVLASALRQIGGRVDATLFMTLLAAYYVLLHRLTGQRDIIVGLPVRNHVSEDMDKVMGFFVNILPLRLQVDPELSFVETVAQVRKAVLDCFSNPDVPLEYLARELNVPRDPSRSPVYQALFSYQDIGERRTRWGDLRYEHVMLPQITATNDLSMWCFGDADGVVADMNYNADILSAESGAAIHRRFIELLEGFRHDPEVAIGDANALSEEDLDALARWNSTASEMPAQKTVHAMLAAQAEAAPERTAIRFNDERVSYAQLDARSTRIADALVARGVRAGDLVGVSLDRHPDLIASMIAVLKTGAAYVPLDPAYPGDRLQFMVEDARLAMVVAEADLATPLAMPRERVLLLDADAAEIDAAPAVVAGQQVDPAGYDSAAYVIYTSGSTGKPKGVQVPHGAVLNFLHSMRNEPGMDRDDRLLAVTTTSFDIAVLEIFLPLSLGAEIVLATRDVATDGYEIAALLERESITLMQATPATWRMLVESGWQGRAGFKALCGGEPLPADLAVQLLSRCTEVWNMYGPTETTVWSTCARVEAGAGGRAPDIHIGKPIANTTVWVLDPRGQVCPIGVSGEIYIGGDGVTLGYLDRPELTAERFVADDFVSRSAPSPSALPARLYRTGDRGRWRRDGVLEHQGRLDFQVKVRGHRIELGEIENTLIAQPEVSRAVVIAREDRPGDVRLVAYVVAQGDASLDEHALIAALRDALPHYMVPQHVVMLESIPLLPNGKVDRKSLPSPQPSIAAAIRSSGANSAESAASGSTLHDPRVDYLMTVWSELLGNPAGPDDNFFDLGGHSMLAVQMANRVMRDTGVRLRLLSLATQTLAQAAALLPEQSGSQSVGESTGNGLSRFFGRLFGGKRRRA
ncbi:non-ribosomal peptide synthetase [Pseudoxanthomonas yeongjuensis]|uniref:non-ribosomal peptide synthetase n=1 Tax=Pseudoxanthomonas yeongjuensis TaxID=377616 RepID=UPI001391A1D1|nr:non-ribosomal peptide synthetase [Pseudoxanthomonas yeongjuensis]KAF1718194.1 non-ribosomal peptide synthetase [Pseudoxanthomonas yeongjuensis]